MRATVESTAPKPPGLLPKNTQQMVILGVAVVMVLIMWLTSGSSKRTKPAPVLPASSAAQAPNPAAVEDFKHSIEERQVTSRQPVSSANPDRLRSLGLAGDVPPETVVAPPAETEIPQPGGIIGGQVSPSNVSVDPLREDRKKRAYLSLFAPNVAFSLRKTPETEYSASASRTNDPSPESEPRQAVPQLGPTAATLGSPPHMNEGATRLDVEAKVSKTFDFNSANGNKFVLFEGTVLETVLINRLDGSFAGPVNCLVTNDIYSHDRQHILIPAGTKALGEAKKVDALGQQRLAVSFHRLIMPDGFSLSLDEFKGLNQTGETALRDKVNNHYVRIFGASLAVGILGGIVEAGTGNTLTNSSFDRVREGFGASMATSSTNILDRFLNILPTVTIREGTRVKVYLSGDLLLPDYAQHTMKADL